jgi:acyl-CoA synthetase (AMP-forming)/AMP-acid ligase II
VQPGDLSLILYTSGTTGPSKGVCCPQAQYFWWAVNTASLLQLRTDDVLCTSLPLFHTNALNTFYQALLTGSCVCYEKRFSASGFFSSLAHHQATVTYLLGAMVPILLSRPVSPEETSHSVRIALAPGVPAQFHEEFTQRTGIRLLDGWGSTETNFVLGAAVEHQKPGLMGPVFEGFQARVVRIMTWWTIQPANLSCGRTIRSRSQPDISVRPRKPSKRGATSGSTRVTGSSARPTAIFGLSIVSKTPSDVGAKISPPSRSSRYYSATPLSRMQRHFPFVHRLPRMK